MERSKKDIIYLLIRGMLCVLTVAVCITLFSIVVSIYFEGIAEGHEGDIFTRDLLLARIGQFAWLFILWFVFIGGEYIAYYALKIVRKKRKPVFYPEDTLRRLKNNLSEDGMKEYEKIPFGRPWQQARLTIWMLSNAVVIVCSAICLQYVFDPTNFPAQNLMGDVATMALRLLPFVIIGFSFVLIARYFDSFVSKRELDYVRTIYSITKARKKRDANNAKIAAEEKRNEIIIWAVRAVVLIAGVVFVIMGMTNGGMQDVFMKAIKICTECIGLG